MYSNIAMQCNWSYFLLQARGRNNASRPPAQITTRTIPIIRRESIPVELAGCGVGMKVGDKDGSVIAGEIRVMVAGAKV